MSAKAPDEAGGERLTRKARQREQPALHSMCERFVAGEDVAHLQRGLPEGVITQHLPPGQAQGAFTAWTDPVPEQGSPAERGGAEVFVPDSYRDDALVLFIHGGAFEYYAPLEGGYDSLCGRIARDSQLLVVSPDFPLSGKGRPFKAPTIMQHLFQSFEWLLRFDPLTGHRRSKEVGVVLVGDSSGGCQAFSLLLHIAKDNPDCLQFVKGVVLISPWLDLSCGSFTYISNAFSEENHTGDVAFRAHSDETRQQFRDMGLMYAGEAELIKRSLCSPYWLARNEDEALLATLERARVPIWMCIGAAETLLGEVMDFVQRLKRRLLLELWVHEGMFHDWVMYASEHDFPSKDAAMRNIQNFLLRVTVETPIALDRGIHYYIEEW